jgi:membrane-associated protease RseP (regulator of RpoE activity)
MRSSAGLQFVLFNFPVRVHISFFITAVLLGLNISNFFLIILWVAIVFVSILLHELGHAIASQYYGRSPSIELLWSGGLTISSRFSLLPYPKEILISFAGPLAGFLLGGLVLLLQYMVGPIANPYLNFLISQLIWVNIGWGIFNLIPIYPMDGGSIMRNLYHWLRNPYDDRTPYKISIFFGILAIIASFSLFRMGGLYIAMLFGLLTYKNFMALRSGHWSENLM